MQPSRAYLVLAIFCLSCLSCKVRQQTSESLSQFANSRRRLATDEELRPILNFYGEKGECTAFLVKNSQNRTLVMTARHCNDYSITRWCKNRGRVTTADGKSEGFCKGVVAAHHTRDIALIEVDGFQPAADGLSLAGFAARIGTRLQMIGFPSDPVADNRPTVTENCWLQKNDDQSGNHPDGNRDQKGRHNCTVYGGNSGGPMLIESTDIVVGLPSTYTPEDFVQRPPNTEYLAYMDLMEDFVNQHFQALVDHGVSIVSSQESKGQPGNYLAVGLYQSKSRADCDIYVKPLYHSIQDLHGMLLDFRSTRDPPSCKGQVTVECRNESSCESKDGKFRVQNWTELAFDFLPGDKAYRYERQLAKP